MPHNKLFNHQQVAFDRYKDASVIPIFFEPGCGKTLTALEIAMYKYEQGLIDCLLVIAPNKVDRQWAMEEIPKWCKDVPTMVWNKKNKKQIPYVAGKLNIVCTNIDQFSTKTRYLDYVEWGNAHKTMIIVDEATKIKNPKAVRTQRLLYEFNDVCRRGKTMLYSTPKTVARCILTGTPITNGAFDVWSMFEFLQPNYFGLNYFAFQNTYGMFYTIQVNGRTVRVLINNESWQKIHACPVFELANTYYGVTLSTYDTIRNQEKYEGPFRNIEQLRQKIAEAAMFMRIEDAQDMPEKVYNRKLLPMSDEQARVYYEMENFLLSTYKGEEVSASTKLVSYIRLQQIASGFVSVEQLAEDEEMDPPPNKIEWFDDVPKMDQLLLDMEEMDDTSPVIIVCHFSAEAERIYNMLVKEGYRCCLMTGWKTVGSIEGFKTGNYDVMVANIRVIGMGFNLQNSHHMIFYSNTFSLEDRIQVEARIYRTGQRNVCIYHDYVMEDTIDMKVFAALKQKKYLADYIRDNSLEDMLTKRDEVFEEEFGEVVF